MSRTTKAVWTLGVVALVAAAASAGVTFDYRQNVNLLNSEDVTITSLYDEGAGREASHLVGYLDYDVSYFAGGFIGPDNKNAITIDFGQTRDLKSVKMWSNWPDYMVTDATVETSPDGSTWTVQPSTTTTPSTRQTNVVLDSAVDAQWLRITGEQYVHAQNRWVLCDLRVYGDSGAGLDPGATLDLVSASGYSAANAVVISQSGGSVAGSLADFVNDNPASLSRRVIYSLGTGDSVAINLDRDIDFGRFGFMIVRAHTDANMHFRVLGATDGVTFDTLLLDQNGGIQADENFFSLTDLTSFTGNALKFEVVSSTMGDLRFGDFFVFQSEAAPPVIPEPATLALVGLGGLAALARRKRRTPARAPGAGEASFRKGQRNIFKALRVLLAAGVVVATASVGQAAVSFDNRENVSILQSVLADISSTHGADPDGIRWRSDYEAGYWQNSSAGIGTDQKTTLTFDLGKVRDVKTLRMFSWYTAYMVSDTSVETSGDGLSWAPAASTTSMPTGNETRIDLDSAVSTQYVRVTGEQYVHANHRWVLEHLLAYGGAGAGLDPAGDVDLVASGGYAASGAVTISQSGGSLVGSLATMADDNPPSLGRRVLYQMGTGDSVTVAFDRDVEFGVFGFAAQGMHVDTTQTFRFQVWGSADGATYDTLLLDQTGGVVVGPNFFDLTGLTEFTGKGLKMQILNSNTGDLRYNDFIVLQRETAPLIPEPASAVLLAAGMGVLLRRRRRA